MDFVSIYSAGHVDIVELLSKNRPSKQGNFNFFGKDFPEGQMDDSPQKKNMSQSAAYAMADRTKLQTLRLSQTHNHLLTLLQTIFL